MCIFICTICITVYNETGLCVASACACFNDNWFLYLDSTVISFTYVSWCKTSTMRQVSRTHFPFAFIDYYIVADNKNSQTRVEQTILNTLWNSTDVTICNIDERSTSISAPYWNITRNHSPSRLGAPIHTPHPLFFLTKTIFMASKRESFYVISADNRLFFPSLFENPHSFFRAWWN